MTVKLVKHQNRFSSKTVEFFMKLGRTMSNLVKV